MPRRLEHVEAARLEAEKNGASIDFSYRTRHICGLISLNGKTRKVFLSMSPSCSRVVMNVREDVRRKIKDILNDNL